MLPNSVVVCNYVHKVLVPQLLSKRLLFADIVAWKREHGLDKAFSTSSDSQGKVNLKTQGVQKRWH